MRRLLPLTLAWASVVSIAGAQEVRVPGDAPTIQAAIDGAGDGWTIRVAPGVYFESISFQGKALSLVSEAGAAVTTLDGSSADLPVVSFHQGEGPGSRLIGFTVQGGMAATGCGAGISCRALPQAPSATPYVADCVITQNVRTSATTLGMGVGGNPTLERCTIAGNGAELFGGDLSVLGGGAGGAPILRSCVIEDNLANLGGGLYLEEGAVVEDCLVRANRAGRRLPGHPFDRIGVGAGLVAESNGVPIPISRTILTENLVDGHDQNGLPTAFGGAAAVFGTVFERCTIVRNDAGPHAWFGGVASLYNQGLGIGNDYTMTACILRDNGDKGLRADQASLRYCNVEGGAPGEGNIDVDPLFDEASGELFALRPDSPCIDAGDPALVDPDGTVADIGAVPFPQAVVRTLPGSGSNPACLTGEPPVVGTSWRGQADRTTVSDALIAVLFVSPISFGPFGLATPLGELLVDPVRQSVPTTFGIFQGDIARFTVPIPDNPGLLGRIFYAQALMYGASTRQLCNGLELVMGREAL